MLGSRSGPIRRPKNGVMKYWDVIIPVCMVLAAFCVAVWHQFANWNQERSFSAILWLLAFLITAEFVVRQSTITRIEGKIDDVALEITQLSATSGRSIDLILDPNDIWRRAEAMIRIRDSTIIDTTSVKNATEYENRIAMAEEAGATIIRVICAPSDRDLNDFIELSESIGRSDISILHLPTSFPFDFLIVESSGESRALVGLKQTSSVGNYTMAFQVNDPLASLHISGLINDQFIRPAKHHMQISGDSCQLCREIKSLQK